MKIHFLLFFGGSILMSSCAYNNEEQLYPASARYINKILEVSGIIGSEETSENNALNISLKTANDLLSGICTLPSAAGSDNFIPGKRVTIRGECSCYLMDVLLNNCVIIK